MMIKPKPSLRWLAAVVFIAAGANHFRSVEFYRSIVPPMFPAPGVLVGISGIFEMMGGVGLLIPALRRVAGWGLIALLVAVFPANVYMAVSDRFAGVLPAWMLWARLPAQGIFIAWVWYVALRKERDETPVAGG